MEKLTTKKIQGLKGKRKITKVTALNYCSAKVIEEAGIDIIGLDGPPIELYFKGEKDGINAGLEELIFCIKAVRRGAPNTFIMSPVPFKISNGNKESIIDASKRLVGAGADAVKIEGAGKNFTKIEELISNGINCVGTIGHNQELYIKQGFRSVGKKADEAIRSFEDAKVLQQLGVIWIEIECIPFKISAEITRSLKIPTIGIGSGPDCDGQFLHSEDILGMHDNYYPKHCKKYMDFYFDSREALSNFKEDVLNEIFPMEKNSFEIQDREFFDFKEKLEL
jgi:3-methyl-2-oxobutanoate hydroxymethyltransferase